MAKKDDGFMLVRYWVSRRPEIVEVTCENCNKRYGQDKLIRGEKLCPRCHNTRLLAIKNLDFPT